MENKIILMQTLVPMYIEWESKHDNGSIYKKNAYILIDFINEKVKSIDNDITEIDELILDLIKQKKQEAMNYRVPEEILERSFNKEEKCTKHKR